MKKYEDINEFPFGELMLKMKKSDLKKSKKQKIPNYPISFDIETTSSESGEAWMYLWGFGFGDDFIMYGRRWEDFLEFFEELNAYLRDYNFKINIFVHNLNFEFCFLYSFIKDKITDYFAKGERDIFYFIYDERIRFRCSGKLTRLNLERSCQLYGTKSHKLHSLDYSVTRYPWTPLKESEMEYFFHDLICVNELIANFARIRGFKHIDEIPITLTACTRKRVRKACSSKEYHARFATLYLDNEIYSICEDNQKGGANEYGFFCCDKIFKNVKIYDYNSLYIYIILCEYFPISRFRRLGEGVPLGKIIKLLKTKCCIFDCTFRHIKLKPGKNFGIIPTDHILNKKDCEIVSKISNRVIEANNIMLSLNEIDFFNILDFYDISGDIDFRNFYTAFRGSMPPEIRDVVFEIYKEKVETSKYKHTDLQFIYDNKKQELNCIAGMIETKIVRSSYELNENGSFDEIKPTQSDRYYKIQKYMKESGAFIYYPWGNWIVSHGRRMNYQLIDCAVPGSHIYHDTDSCFATEFDHAKLDALNAAIHDKVVKCGYDLGRLGEAELDCAADEVKILGLKTYAKKVNGEIEITVAGVPKKEAYQLENDLNNFKYGFKFKNAAKLTTFVSSPVREIEIEDKSFITGGYCHIKNFDFVINKQDRPSTRFEALRGRMEMF